LLKITIRLSKAVKSLNRLIRGVTIAPVRMDLPGNLVDQAGPTVLMGPVAPADQVDQVAPADQVGRVDPADQVVPVDANRHTYS
jgi:hypothetical protein